MFFQNNKTPRMLLTLPTTVSHSDGLKRHVNCGGAMESWIKSKADQLAQAQHIFGWER